MRKRRKKIIIKFNCVSPLSTVAISGVGSYFNSLNSYVGVVVYALPKRKGKK